MPFRAISGEAPSAPVDLTAEATSYTDISLAWTNTEDPENVAGMTIDRKVGAAGDWEQAANGLPGDASSYEQSDLKDGTQYCYRVRANNVFGVSDWSNEACVGTPVDERERLVRTEGVDGYDGTLVIAIAQNSPDDTFTAEELSFDQGTSDYGAPDAPAHGLIRFDGLFDGGGLPQGAVITGATLRFWTTSSSTGPVGLHRMLRSWNDTSTWNGLVDGVQADDAEAAAEPDDSKSDIQGSAYLTYDVTASVQAWAAGAPNDGWLILNTSTDGWDVATDLYSGTDAEERRPRLTIFYESGGDDADAGFVDTDSVADLNGNGAPELAVLQVLPTGGAQVVIKDSVTKAPVRTIGFDAADAEPIGVAGLGDATGNGSADVAVLFRKPNGQGLVQVKDGGTGGWIGQLLFVGPKWEVESVTAQDADGDGVPDIAVLAESDDGTRAAVQIRKIATKAQINWIGFATP